ncbi:MAG: hypothetical protein COY73_00710 [Candidatus Nealsonbacteria bacterium CG_4_10_14_0_8_um_filter_37_14]|uniref:Uncharacterized protein n=1 Tax=Candidatus Nealsonbacteria bacterium CG_4_10_14_0_8_um_filter_37_14 TaxID=1974684 RepID=A0A2M7R7J0_9BACT|nr:MAG: hypothetical protein COV63_01725 [Candidatus Nealsonbacteria bacterium CG11_big_fil_rev_8_21_14_0_20_37_68]PIW91905.1 MAG: hypothetical protein COZ89_02605 [Candidatus Nealsonbacteria bacterium CG_4_8_14_3_um_filter_37_23]PIY89513.1 MAG: hypothetical protein COY73_00710 [Candidatus Nealsonbacteria bacterium CG_4_10_14_0_8_um_filter_37_14]
MDENKERKSFNYIGTGLGSKKEIRNLGIFTIIISVVATVAFAIIKLPTYWLWTGIVVGLVLIIASYLLPGKRE